jgi:hypothetical protein
VKAYLPSQVRADAYIGKDGVCVRGALHTWKQSFTQLKQVRLELDREQPALEFDIRYLTRLGVLHHETRTVEVQVPRAQESQAEESRVSLPPGDTADVKCHPMVHSMVASHE